jgi:hypothetical protein
MLTDNRQILALGIIPDYSDAGLSRVPRTGFHHGTYGPAE